MDPRRARDPRLARPDPRLQRQGQPSLPQYNNTPPFSYPSYPEYGPSNGSSSHSQTPSQMPPYSSGSVSNQQLTEEAQAASVLPPPGPSIQPAPPPVIDAKSKLVYKPRPLFCVVCASNQVCACVTRLLTGVQTDKAFFVESVNGGTLCALVGYYYSDW
jgi:RNA polymerase II subunit A C-terminal domain phosphatase SSU72